MVETPKLYRSNALAEALEVTPHHVMAMRRAGFEFTHGTRTTLASAYIWLAAFPQFRMHHYIKRGWRDRPKLKLSELTAATA